MPPPATPKKLPDKTAKKGQTSIQPGNLACKQHTTTASQLFTHDTCTSFYLSVVDAAVTGAEESLSVEDEKVFLQRQLDALKLQLGQRQHTAVVGASRCTRAITRAVAVNSL